MTPEDRAPAGPWPFRDRAFWALAAATAAFFGWPLLAGRTYFFRDLYFWSFPQRERLAELLRQGTLPLWDATVYGGQPLLGNVQYFPLYPTSLLGLVLPPVTAVNVEIVLHFTLCAAAAYALARAVGASPGASAVAGVVFVFCGTALSLGNLLARLLATPHTVLLLLFWHRFLAEGRRRWFLLAAACGALQIFAASAEQLVFAGLLAAAWGLVFPYPPACGSRARRLGLAAALAAAIFGLAAVQILPMVEIVRDSWRGAGLPSSERAVWSVDPRRLLELVVPGFFGDTHTLREADYWGGSVEDMGFPMLLSFYFGAAALGLAVAGAASRDDRPLPAPVRRLLAGLLFGAILLSLGRFLPHVGSFDPSLLLGGIFRYPVKWLFATPLPAALLAAHAADAAVRSPAFGRRLSLGLASAALLLAALGALVARSPSFAAGFCRAFFRQDAAATIAAPLSARFLWAAAAAGAVALLLRSSRAAGSRLLPGLLAVLLALDLAGAGRRVNPTAPRSLLTDVPPLAETVRRDVGDGRFYRDVNPKDLSLSAPSNEIRWRYEWNRRTLAFYTAAGFGIPQIFQISADGLDLARHERLTAAFLALPWPRRLPLLSAASVRLFLTSDEVGGDGVRLVDDVRAGSNRTFHLYANGRAAERATLVTFWRHAATPDEAIRAMASPGFDPRRHAVVEGPPRPAPAGCAGGDVSTVARGPLRASFRTRSNCPAYLVLSEPFAPGWRARVDGAPAPMAPANEAFSAVFLEPGEHLVERRYVPRALEAGGAISLVAAALLLAWARRGRRRGAPQPA